MIRVLLALLVLTSSATADTAASYLYAGDYNNAVKAAVAAKDSQSKWAGFDAAMLSGQLSEAQRLAKELSKFDALDADVAQARLEFATGKRQSALSRLGNYVSVKRGQVKIQPSARKHYLLQIWKARLLHDSGRIADAESLFKKVIRSGKLASKKYEEHAFLLGTAYAYLEEYERANARFRDGRRGKRHRGNVAWGNLFLNKYSIGDAQASFEDVLKFAPNHPHANVGMAKVVIAQSYNLDKAMDYLQVALKTNPQNTDALAMQASLAIDRNDWSRAYSLLDKVHAVDPEHLEGHALRATIHWILDDNPAYEKRKALVMKINPKFARFFHIVARSAQREHRYKRAVDLELEAIKLKPDYYEAMQSVGSGYLRLGEEKEGIKWLEKAFKGDPYNVRTFNLLNLFDDTIPNDYEFIKVGDLRFRYHKEEKALLRHVVEPFLVDAYQDMIKRYKFEPAKPTTIELFKSLEHYSVRTVGLPNLGALGVCFGKVVTARSPYRGDANWGMVLYHELSHVFAVQLSNYRVPRWYTEGLSEYETLRKDPSWRRENDAQLADLLRSKRIPSIVDLNHMFLSRGDVMNAYYLSAVTIDYLVGNYGFDKIVDGLRMYGKGNQTGAVIGHITGLSVEQFDKKFQSYLSKRLARYLQQFQLPQKGYDDPVVWEKNLSAKPNDAQTRAGLALSWFYAGDAGKTISNANKALEIDSKNALATYLLAEVSYVKKNWEEASKYFSQMIANGQSSYEILGRLAGLAQKAGDTKKAIAYWCAAKKARPEWSVPYSELYELHKKEGNLDRALLELQSYVRIEQMAAGPAFDLLEQLVDRSQWNGVVQFARHAIFIAPAEPRLHVMLSRANNELGNPKEALHSAEAAMLLAKRNRRPGLAQIELARALNSLGKKGEALAAINAALASEPGNQRALKLKREIQK